MKKQLLFLFTCIGLCLLTIAQTATGIERKDEWKFQNFGVNSSGNMKVEKNRMALSTRNTRHCFNESDLYSFAWQKQSFPYDDCSKLSITVKIDKFPLGSAGIMMRSGERQDAANVHLEVNATGDVYLFDRKKNGESTGYTRLTNLSFPIELKLVRQGSVFTGYYKNEAGDWTKGNSTMANVGAESLAGFYACSGSESQIGYTVDGSRSTDVSFHDWTFDYEENYIPAEKGFTDKMPVKEGTLLRDNFNDGSLSNTPESIINPVWTGIQYGNLPYDKTGGRYWRKTGDGIFYLGNKKWADYEVSMDLAFDSERKFQNEFLLQVRYQSVSVYTKMARYYAVVLRDGNKLFFEKYEGSTVTFSRSVDLPGYLDGSKHVLKVRMLDRNYEVYYDNKLLIHGTDTLNPITYGNTALKFTGAALNIDNLEVIRIDDPANGTTDNYLMDYFDTAVPEYLKKYGY